MDSKAIAILLLVACACAEAATVNKLTLATGATRGMIVGGNDNNPGSTSTYEFDVNCGQNGPLIGTCAETGINLSRPKDYKTAQPKRQMTLWQFSCDITQQCGDIGVGMFNGLGMAPAGDWNGSYPLTFNIVGGTGAYENVLGGRALFTSDSKLDLTLFS